VKHNFQEYSLDDLYDAFEQIDKELYPERFEEVRFLIKVKSKESITEAEEEAKFKAKEIIRNTSQQSPVNSFNPLFEFFERRVVSLIITLLTLKRKTPHFIVTVIIWWSVWHVTESYLFSYLISIVFFVCFYWYFTGPIHLSMKKDLLKFVDKNLIINTEISPFSKEKSSFKINDSDWKYGNGIIGTFDASYQTNISANGLAFYFHEIPYYPLHILPWKSIKSIQPADSQELVQLTETYDILLINGESILLPIKDIILFTELLTLSKGICEEQ